MRPGKPPKPQPKRKPKKTEPLDEPSGIGFDDLLRKMLATPPTRHKKTAAKRGG